MASNSQDCDIFIEIIFFSKGELESWPHASLDLKFGDLI